MRILISWLLRSFQNKIYTQSKMLILSTNIDSKLLETEFLIGICSLTGDKWQSKTLFLAIFDLRLSIVKSIFNSLPVCRIHHCN